jgi:hypothetical protein
MRDRGRRGRLDRREFLAHLHGASRGRQADDELVAVRRRGSALRPDHNHLRIEVANLWIHDVARRPAPDLAALEETYGVRWGRYGEVQPEAIPPAGLLGPVRLLPLRRITLRL